MQRNRHFSLSSYQSLVLSFRFFLFPFSIFLLPPLLSLLLLPPRHTSLLSFSSSLHLPCGIFVPACGGSARWNPVGSIIRRIPIVYRLVLHVYLIPRLVRTPQSTSYVIYVPGFVLSPAYLPLSLYPTVSRCRASEKGRMQIATQLRGVKSTGGFFNIHDTMGFYRVLYTDTSFDRAATSIR